MIRRRAYRGIGDHFSASPYEDHLCYSLKHAVRQQRGIPFPPKAVLEQTSTKSLAWGACAREASLHLKPKNPTAPFPLKITQTTSNPLGNIPALSAVN